MTSPIPREAPVGSKPRSLSQEEHPSVPKPSESIIDSLLSEKRKDVEESYDDHIDSKLIEKIKAEETDEEIFAEDVEQR